MRCHYRHVSTKKFSQKKIHKAIKTKLFNFSSNKPQHTEWTRGLESNRYCKHIFTLTIMWHYLPNFSGNFLNDQDNNNPPATPSHKQLASARKYNQNLTIRCIIYCY